MEFENRLWAHPQLPRLTPADLIWEVVQDHRDEAGFLWSQWELLLRAPHVALPAVEEGVESRLRAHVTALALAASTAHEALLSEALDEPDPEPVFATILAFLEVGGAPANAAVDLLISSQGASRVAALRAFGLAGDLALPSRLTDEDPTARAALSRSPDPESRAFAARLSAPAPVRPAPPDLETAHLRDAARRDRQTIALALSASPADAALLVEMATSPDAPSASAALHAIGFSRLPSTWEACLSALTATLPDSPLRPVAADSLAALAGADLLALGLAAPPILPGGRGDPADHQLALTPESFLPRPDAARVAAWWSSQGRAAAEARAASRTPLAILADLADRSMWRHLGWSMELALLTRGAAKLDPFAFTRDQASTLKKLVAPRSAPLTPTPGGRSAPARQ